MGSFSCVLFYKTAEILWDKKTGAIAGLIAAFYGIFIFYDIELLKPSLVNFLLVLTFYFFVRLWKKPEIRLWIFSGFTFTTALLLRMHLALVLPAIFIWIFTAFRGEYSRFRFRYFLIFCLAAMVTYNGWRMWLEKTVPNQIGSFAESGIHFYIGNNPAARGTYTRIENVRGSALGHTVDARKIVEKEKKRSVTAGEVNQYWFEKGMKYIQKNPRQWLALEFKKIFLAFNAYEVPNDENYDFTRKNSWFLSLPLISYNLIAPFGLLGIFLYREKESPITCFLIAYLGLYLLSLLLTFVTSAYRLPMHLPLILFSAYALHVWIGFCRQGQGREIKMTVGVFLILFAFTNYATFIPNYDYDLFVSKRIQNAKTNLDEFRKMEGLQTISLPQNEQQPLNR